MTHKQKLTPMALNFLALMETLGNGNTTEIVEIENEGGDENQHTIDLVVLQQAITLTAEKHPRLKCRLERKWPRYYWVYEQKKTLTLQVENFPANLQNQSEEETYLYNQVWKNKKDPFLGDGVSFHFYRGKEKSYLQVLSCHMLSDGKSGFNLIADIISFYNQLLDEKTYQEILSSLQVENEQKKLVLSPYNFLHSLSLPQKISFYAQTLFKIMQDLFSFSSQYSLKTNSNQTDPFQLSEMQMIRFVFPEESLSSLQKSAKEQKITLHSLLTQGLFRFFSPLMNTSQQKKLKVMDTFCLRSFNHQALNSSYDLLMLPYPLLIEKNKYAHQELQQLKQGKILVEFCRQQIYSFMVEWAPRFLLPFLVKFMGTFFIKSSVVLSNLGPIPYEAEKMGSLRVMDFYTFSVCFPPGRLAFIFSTFRRRLRVTLVGEKKNLDHLKSFHSLSDLQQIFKQL